MKKIWEYIDKILTGFWDCFSTEKSFHWFVTAVLGMMLRSDTLGVSSIVRGLRLKPNKYESLVNFYRSKAWKLLDIICCWLKIVYNTGLVVHSDGKPILIGDAVKQNKESTRMPCVKKMRQESEDSSKAEHIIGHMFGGLGILIGNNVKKYCLPISMTLHDGCRPILEWLDSEYKNDSHVTRLVKEACHAAVTLGKACILLMDRAFLSVPALKTILDEAKKAIRSQPIITLITKAKSNAVAFGKPEPERDANGNIVRHRGQPKKKGDRVELKKLFTSRAKDFITTELEMYGQMETVKYLCVDLLWGDGLYQLLRFVLVVTYQYPQSILVCTDTTLDPTKIIQLYTWRFSIESCFKTFKQLICGFGYHFWSDKVPLLSKWKSAKKTVEELAKDVAVESRDVVISTYKAIEGFVMVSCVALGILQMVALLYSELINNAKPRWLRSFTKSVPSEETTLVYLAESFPRILKLMPFMAITEIINSIRDEHIDYFEDAA